MKISITTNGIKRISPEALKVKHYEQPKPMCKFYSAIVSKNGELYHNPFSTSHEEIIDSCDLKDDPSLICRIEFYPKDEKDISDYKKYQLHFDDQRSDWFTDQMESDIVKKLKGLQN